MVVMVGGSGSDDDDYDTDYDDDCGDGDMMMTIKMIDHDNYLFDYTKHE